MPRPELPRFRPFTIPGLPWDFVDFRSLDPIQQGAASTVLVQQSQNIANRTNRKFKTELCGTNEDDRTRADARFEALKEADPGYTYEQFEADGGTQWNEVCPDPRKPTLGIVAMSAKQEVVGCIFLTSIVRERVTPALIKATAMPSPGFRRTPRLTRIEVWTRVMRWLLNNNLVFRNDVEFDLVGWDLPRTRRFRWSSDDLPGMSALFDELSVDADRESDADDASTPVRFRRKGE